MRKLIMLLACTFVVSVAWAIDEGPAFEDPVLNERYRALIREIRCVKCQNQNIADSNALIASDLRREVRRLLEEGASDKEVTDFLVERYGEFVLYRPPLQPTTWALWGAPFLLLVIGSLVFARVLVTRAAQPLDDDPDEETEQEERRS